MEDFNPSPSTSAPHQAQQLEGPVAAAALALEDDPMEGIETLEETSPTPTSSSSSFPPFNGGEGEAIPSTSTQAAGGGTLSPENCILSSTTSTPSPHQFGGGGSQENGEDSPSPPQGAESSTASPPCPEEPVAGASTSSSPTEDFEEDFEELPQSSSGGALTDLLAAVDTFEPTIPDGVTNYLLTQAGFQSEDPRLARLLSLATQKFISDVVNESFTICKLKGQLTNLNQQAKAKLKDKKYSLTLEDLGPVLSDNGITVKKPPYYT